MYDLIGDIHGHAHELHALLKTLGYRQNDGVYRHPERKVIFLGDFIDRGPEIEVVLTTVRAMVEGGSALAVLGNHELNALAYDTPRPNDPGQYMRKRNEKNTRQHCETLKQLTAEQRADYLAWFRTLPLWLECDGLRVVHACWDDDAIASIAAASAEYGGLTTPFLQSAYDEDHPLFDTVETVLKGREGPLPDGVRFTDKEGHERTRFRTRWYLNPQGHTYRTYALQAGGVDCDEHLAEAIVSAAAPYPPDAPPVFVGHYWLSAARPEVLTHNVACLDYSVAKHGFLCAYRFDGESRLQNEKFVWVNSRPREAVHHG